MVLAAKPRSHVLRMKQTAISDEAMSEAMGRDGAMRWDGRAAIGRLVMMVMSR